MERPPTPEHFDKNQLIYKYVEAKEEIIRLKNRIQSQAQLSQDLQRVTQEKLDAQSQLASLNLEFETLKSNVEQLNRDKLEITQVNNDLQQRLQQMQAQAQLSQELQRVTQEKMEAKNQLASLNLEFDTVLDG